MCLLPCQFFSVCPPHVTVAVLAPLLNCDYICKITIVDFWNMSKLGQISKILFSRSFQQGST